MIRFPHSVLALGSLVAWSAADTARAQGIPAVSGVLQTEVRGKVPRGTPPTLTLRTPDRPAAFYARCVFGSPEQEVVQESDSLEAGEGFVVVLPPDTSARTAECAVVARFANGLSERKPVSMRWEVIDPAADGETDEKPEEDDEKPPTVDSPEPAKE